MHAGLREWLTDTVQQAIPTGVDDYGQPTYAPAIARPARVEYKTQTIVNRHGQEVTSRCRIFLDSSPVITLDHQLVLEDGTAPTVQQVYPVRDVEGSLHHYEVWV